MIEVEVKLPVADMDGIKAKLLKMGFTESCFIQERDTYFDITVRLTNGWALTTYNKKIDLYSREDEVVVFYKNDIGGRIFLRFNPNKIRLVNNVLTLKGIDASVDCDWDCWDGKMSDEEAERERKNFNDNVRVESATFTKVMTYNVSKYVDV